MFKNRNRIIFLIIIIIILIFIFIHIYRINILKLKSNNSNIPSVETKSKADNNEQKNDNIELSVENNTSDTSNNETKVESNYNKLNEDKKDNNDYANESNTVKEAIPPNTSSEHVKKEEYISNSDQPEEKNSDLSNQKEKNNPWDSLGITEYEFYNSPAHSWAELDFKISDYGSREATLNACKDYGNKYIAENSGGYFCDSVNSYSGDYLGEDIDFY